MPKKTDFSFIKGPITTKELGRMGITPTRIQSLVKAEHLLRLGRGVYQLPEEDLSDENIYRAATKRIKGKSAVCLLSALAHYNLIDEIPKQTWLLVNTTRRTYLKDIRLFRSHNPNWKIGIETADGYRITTLERTIVDSIVYKSKLGNLGLVALRKALRERLSTGHKVLEMARLLKVEDRIIPFIEALV